MAAFFHLGILTSNFTLHFGAAQDMNDYMCQTIRNVEALMMSTDDLADAASTDL
jgi:hypothetical protein